MRRLLVERARRKRRARHGGGRARIDLEDLNVEAERRAGDILALDEALERLTAEEPMAAEVVELRYFAGLTAEEAAAADSAQLERSFASPRVRPARCRSRHVLTSTSTERSRRNSSAPALPRSPRPPLP